MGWLVALGIIAGLAVVPVGIRAVYDHNGALVKLLLGPVSIFLFPREKKKQQKVKTKESAAASKSGEENKKGGSVKDFLPLAQLVFDFLGDFRRKLTVRRLEMKLLLAGDDPCDVAVNYGRAWATLGNLIPQLDRLFRIKKRDMSVACDFTTDTPQIYARADITITLGRLTALAVYYGYRGLREYLKIMNQKKGGA